MNLLERFAHWIGLDAQASPRPELVALRTALDEGRRYKREGSYELSLASFDRAVSMAQHLSDQPAMAIIHLHRADLFIRQARWDEARELLERLQADAKASGNHIQHAYTLTSLGTLAQARDDWNAARDYYEEALRVARSGRSSGAEGRALCHLADTYLHEGNASYAVYLFQEGLPHLHTSGDVELSSYFVGRLGEAQIAMGNTTDGYELIGRALRLAQQMKYRRYECLWRVALGHYATVEEQYADALNHYQSALEILPPNAPERFTVQRDLSLISLYLDRLEDALVYAERAHALQPDDPQAQGVLGMVLRALGRSDVALPYLERATAAGEIDNLEVLRALAFVLDDTGDEPAALATYQRAVALATEREDHAEIARCQRDLALFHTRYHRLSDAIRAFGAAIEYYDREGHGNDAQIARLHCDIARLREFVGQGLRAMKDYEQALMRLGSINDPDTRGVVLSNAARAYLDTGDLETAEAFFSESIQIAQKLHDLNAEAIRQGNFGWFLLMTGRVKRAVGALEYALQQSQRLRLPLNVVVQTTNLAQAYAESGNLDQALAMHRRAEESLYLLDDAAPLVRDHWRAVVQVNLAQALISAGETGAPTQLLLDNALRLAQAQQDHEAYLRALTVQGYLLVARRSHAAAFAPLHEALNLARRAGNKRLSLLPLVYLSRAHAAAGDQAQALAVWDDAQRLLALYRLAHYPSLTPTWL